MRVKTTILAAIAALTLAAPAVAHDSSGWGNPYPYCGFGDGGFDQGWFDRYQGTYIVTPGAPGSGPTWHAVYHVYAHFYGGSNGNRGWQYTAPRLCRWAWW